MSQILPREIEKLKPKSVLALFFAFVVPVLVASQSTPDPLIGVWKLNVAESTFDPGPPRISETVTIEPYGENGLKTTADVIDAQGKRFVIVSAGFVDGKEFAAKGDSNADTYSMMRVDANTIDRTSRKAGQVTIVLRRSVSKDGKTQTVTTRGNTVNGHPLRNILIFERQ
jgi:hypothetical protein